MASHLRRRVRRFADPNQIVAENYYFEDEGEQRHLAIGMTLD